MNSIEQFAELNKVALNEGLMVIHEDDNVELIDSQLVLYAHNTNGQVVACKAFAWHVSLDEAPEAMSFLAIQENGDFLRNWNGPKVILPFDVWSYCNKIKDYMDSF